MFKVGQVWLWENGHSSALEQVTHVFPDGSARSVVIDHTADKAFVGLHTTISLPTNKTLAFDSQEQMVWDLSEYSLVHNDVEPDQLPCTCDFIKVVLPYGCKCGGK
jgi:hypothetical protein